MSYEFSFTVVRRSACRLLEKHNYVVVPLEPTEPKYAEFLKLNQAADSQEIKAEKETAFANYIRALLDTLSKRR